MSATTATVETLTAEVRVLTVGNRQVTLSIARQLDFVAPEDMEPFGRINATWGNFTGPRSVTVIGRVRGSGVLALSGTHPPPTPEEAMYREFLPARPVEEPNAARHEAWAALPLVVLAGLR